MSSRRIPRRTAAPARTDVDYGFYRIIAGERDGIAQANAYLGMGKIETCEAATVEEAVKDLTAVLDARMARLRQGRAEDVPTQDEFAEAISAIVVESRQQVLDLLRLHAKLPDSTATIGDLARRCGTEQADVAAAYARFGRQLAALLDFAPEAEDLDDALAPLLTFAQVTQRDGRTRLQLRAEVKDAVEGMNEGA